MPILGGIEMAVYDQDINIKFMQSVELLYLNDDDAIANVQVSAGELLGDLARYLRLSIQLDEDYSGKGISVDIGEDADIGKKNAICYSFDQTRGCYDVKWGDMNFCIDRSVIPLEPIFMNLNEGIIENEALTPDLVVHKKGFDTNNIAFAEIKKNIDPGNQTDLKNLVQSFIKLCCFTWDETGQQIGMYSAGLYFGLHRDYCYVFVFRNGKIEIPCYRFEKRTGIWKKLQPEEIIGTSALAV
jgi:hypothetical protein